MIALAIVESVILLLLSGLHFYWAVGGQWGFDSALPTNTEGRRVLNPRPIESFIVGAGLLTFSFFFLIESGQFRIQLPVWMTDYYLWVVAGIFTLRAIGDFRYIGFFKSVKSTPFARSDSYFFSPLCLFLGIGAGIIGWSL